ncbi:MAG: hypothetical protein ACPG77_00160 [Nannocystaceae bacterium]
MMLPAALALGCTRPNPAFFETESGPPTTSDTATSNPTTTDTGETQSGSETVGDMCIQAPPGAPLAQQPARLTNTIINLGLSCGEDTLDFYAQIDGSTFQYCTDENCNDCDNTITLSFSGVDLNTQSTCFRGVYKGEKRGDVCNTKDVILWEADATNQPPLVIYTYEDPTPLPEVSTGVEDILEVSRLGESVECTCTDELPLNCCEDISATCSSLRFQTNSGCVDAENGTTTSLVFAGATYDLKLVRSFTTPYAAGNDCASEPLTFSMWVMLRK